SSWSGCGIGVGDVTGDGRADVAISVCGNQPNAFIDVFPQTPNGTIGAVQVHNSLDIPDPIVIRDVNADGRNDIVDLHGGWNNAGVYLQTANGTLGSEALYPIPYASWYEPKGL